MVRDGILAHSAYWMKRDHAGSSGHSTILHLKRGYDLVALSFAIDASTRRLF